MTLSYDYKADDLACWLRHHLRSSPSARRGRVLVTFAWFALFATLASCVAYYFGSFVVSLACYSLVVLFTFLAWRSYDRVVERTVRAKAADPQLQGGYGPIQLTLSEEGLREVTPTTDSLARWSGVSDVIRDSDHIYVRLATGQAAIISRRSYSGPVPFDEIPRAIDELRKRHAA